MVSKSLLFDFPVILSSLICSKWLHVSDLCQLDSACCEGQLRRSLLAILGYEGTALNGIDFTANVKFMRWLSLRKGSIGTLEYDGATNLTSFGLVSERICRHIKALKVTNVCGDELKAFLYKSCVLQSLIVSKLRKTSKRRVIALDENIEPRTDCCSLLTDLTFQDMSTIPSEIISSLMGQKVHSLSLCKFGNFSKEFANITATRLSNLRSLCIDDTKELTDSRLARILKVCTRLTSLELSHCAMLGTETVVNISEHCRDLQRLKLSHIRSYEEGFDAAFSLIPKNCCQILEIVLIYVQISDASLIAIVQHMKCLVSLECVNCYELHGVGTVQPDPFAVSRLENIRLKNCTGLTSLMNICQACPLLRVLDLTDCPWLAYGALTHILMHACNLEKLVLNSQKAYGRDLDIVSTGNLSKLRVMDLSSSAITDEGLGYICSICPNIAVLCVDNCWELTNDGLANLGLHCPHLEVLSMNREPNISEIGLMSAVAYAPALRALVFSLELNMTHTALIALAHLDVKNLQTIAISGFQFGGLYVQAVMSLLDSARSLRWLYLDVTCSFATMHSPTPCNEDDKNAFVAMLKRIYPTLHIITSKSVDKLNALEM